MALRASIVIGARSRSFRFLVRLVERMPVLALPAWRRFRTQPIDERDIIEMLASCAGSPSVGGRSLDVGGPDVLSYGEMVAPASPSSCSCIAPRWASSACTMTPIAARLAAAIAGEDPDLVIPLMEGLQGDLLAADDHAAELLRAWSCTHSTQLSSTHCWRVEKIRAAGRALSNEPPGSPASLAPGATFALAMSSVTASIGDRAPTWEMIMDPARLGDWVTIHRKLLHADEGAPRVGYRMDQQIHLRGVGLEVHWKLIDCRPGELAIWGGTWARARRATPSTYCAQTDGTRFDYRNEFHAPLGPIGAIASRALVGGMPEREAKRTLERLRTYRRGQ